MPKAEIDPAGLDAADLTKFAGQGIFDARFLETDIGVELRAFPPKRIEIDRACAFHPPARGTRQVADSLAMVLERDDVDDVVDDIIVAVEAGLAPRSELVADLCLKLPALWRDEIRIAGIGAVIA